MSLRTLDLFCGGGGSSWGAQAAGAQIVCGVDAWETAAATFGDNFRSAKPVCTVLDGRATRKVVGDIGDIDLMLASPECTNHTCAKGSGRRDEASRRTARYVLNYARTFKPRWIVIENVVSMREWAGYDPLVRELSQSYQILPQVLDACDFGVPQTRRRLFLVCDRDRQPDEIRVPTRRRRRKVEDILDPPGTWPSRPLKIEGRAPATLQRAERAISSLGKGVPFLIVYYGSDGSGGWQSLDRPIRTLTTLDRFGLVEWHFGEPYLRMLQVPELRRAMGFTQAYRMRYGSRRDQIRMLGNGVCPPVMKAVIQSLSTKSDESLEAHLDSPLRIAAE